MKALTQFVFPTVKAVMTVITFIIGLGWGAYAMVQTVARTEASTVREEIKVIRMIDKEHFDGRFDRIEKLIKEIK
jgi:predicted negative regulator of RcsB-dependent stress response